MRQCVVSLLAILALGLGSSRAQAEDPPRPPYLQGSLSTLNYGMTSGHVAGNGGLIVAWAGYPRLMGLRFDFLSSRKIALGIDTNFTPAGNLVQAGPEAEFRLNFRWQLVTGNIYRAPFFMTLRLDPGYGIAGGRLDGALEDPIGGQPYNDPLRIRHAIIFDPTMLFTLQIFDPVAFNLGAGFAMSFLDDFPVVQLTRQPDEVDAVTFRLRFTLGVDIAFIDVLGAFGEAGFEIGIGDNAPAANGFFRVGAAFKIPGYGLRDELWEGLPDEAPPSSSDVN